MDLNNLSAIEVSQVKHDQLSLIPFTGLIVTLVFWIVVVVVLFPRCLGHLLSFFFNRTARDNFHISIPFLHVYLLAGRVVAHSVLFTTPNMSIAVEELVLQCRWWHRPHASVSSETLSVDSPQTFDPVARAQEEVDRQNAAIFCLRIWYRLRRCWRRSFSDPDSSSPDEPNSLISIMLIGLRVRLVNNQANYTHVQEVLALVQESSQREPESATSNPHVKVPVSCQNSYDNPQISSPSQFPLPSRSADVDYTNLSTANIKLQQRILELTSLRIVSGSLFVCDMGMSPLTRVTVDSAKVRYRCGAPACPVDEFRSRVRIGMSSLRVSTVSKHDVEFVLNSSVACGSHNPHSDASCNQKHANGPKSHSIFENTNRLIKRVCSQGYRGLLDSSSDAGQCYDNLSTVQKESDCSREPFGNKLSFLVSRSNCNIAASRKVHSLPYVDILHATTGVLEYVADEPGSDPATLESHITSCVISGNCNNTGTSRNIKAQPSPPPLRQLSVLLYGAELTYDFGGMSYLFQTLGRLQTTLYDHSTFSELIQKKSGKRTPGSLKVDIEATPKSVGLSGLTRNAQPHTLRIPFLPQKATWLSLVETNICDGRNVTFEDDVIEGPDVGESVSRKSYLDVRCSRLSFHVEGPSNGYRQQKLMFEAQDPDISVRGVVSMPLLKSRGLSLTRVIHLPEVWHEVHVVSTEVCFSTAEIFYVPDLHRVIGDIFATSDKHGVKPPTVNHFVPHRETIKICTSNTYSITLSCGRENTWDDILSGEAEQYGKVKLYGDYAELLLSPTTSTVFFAESYARSWSLSLPNLVAKVELPVSIEKKSESSSLSSTRELLRTIKCMVRPSSNTGNNGGGDATAPSAFEAGGSLRSPHRSVELEILHFGGVCKVSGKSLYHEVWKYLDSDLRAFPDAINTSDIFFTTSELTVDLNPHHISHILNVVRNYSGAGAHIVSTAERASLDKRRQDVAREVMYDGRLPNQQECLILGLLPGYTLSPIVTKSGEDDVTRVSIDIEHLLIRLHDLPHALTQFDFLSPNICSVATAKILGTIHSNRLGSDLTIALGSGSSLSLSMCCLPMQTDIFSFDSKFKPGMLPRILIEKFHIRKVSVASELWSTFFSCIYISIECVEGCILDYSVYVFTRVGAAFAPDPISEHVSTIAALLSVDSIELSIGSVDLFLLSPSTMSLDFGYAQMRTNVGDDQILSTCRAGRSILAQVPLLLAGVTHICLASGFRLITSTLALEKDGQLSRFSFPSITATLIVPSDCMTIPWVDEPTLRAQVAYVELRNMTLPRGLVRNSSTLVRAFNVSEIHLEIVHMSRPSRWTSKCPQIQARHVFTCHEENRLVDLPWCTGLPARRLGTEHGCVPLTDQNTWWDFLLRSEIATKGSEHRPPIQDCVRQDTLSVQILENVVISFSPDIFSFFYDMLPRLKISDFCTEPRFRTDPSNARIGELNMFPHELITLWHVFERLQPPDWTLLEGSRQSSYLQLFETKALMFEFIAPVACLDEMKFSLLSRKSKERIFLRIPLGVHMFVHNEHLPNLDTLSKSRQLHLMEGNVRTNVFQVSLPSVIIGYNNFDLMKASNMLFINHIRNSFTKVQDTGKTGCSFRRRDRGTIVVKIGTLNVGEPTSALDPFAKFGLILSIFLLFLRSVSVETNRLLNIQSSRLSSLSERLTQSVLVDLPSRDPSFVRALFANALQCVFTVQNDLSRSRSNADRNVTLPSISGNKRIDVVPIQSAVMSLDVSLQEFSFTIQHQDLIRFDSFSCKGGKTSSKDTIDLGGYVLNASIGAILLAIRDDVATSTLKMVSKVASFVGHCIETMPTLRHVCQICQHDGIFPRNPHGWAERTQFKSHSSYKCDTESLVRSATADMNLPNHVQLSFDCGDTSTHHHSSGLGQLDHSRRWKSSIALRSKRSCRTNSFSRRTPGRGLNIGSVKSPCIEQEDDFSCKKVYSSQHLLPETPQSISLSRGPSMDTGSSTQLSSTHASNHQPKTVDNFELSADHNFMCIAVRTAGDSGPPRKRSKCMIPTKSLPPVFTVSDTKSDVSYDPRHTTLGTPRTGSINRTGNSQPKNLTKPSVPGLSKLKTTSIEPSFGDMRTNKASSNLDILEVTLFLSCRDVTSRYFRGGGRSVLAVDSTGKSCNGNIEFIVHAPKITFMQQPHKGRSVVVTTTSTQLFSSTNPRCTLSGSTAQIGVMVSLTPAHNPSQLPKLIVSSRISNFESTLQATDLQTVLQFRESFKKDLLGLMNAFVSTKQSLFAMVRASKLSQISTQAPTRYSFSTLAYDTLFERSEIKLKGFHPRDSFMTVSYVLGGMFFSLAAFKNDDAALTLALRNNNHGIRLSSSSWPDQEFFCLPSFDAFGVQWAEKVGLPTIIKVTTKPLVSLTSFQGLRHILFTVAGLLAFQNTASVATERFESCLSLPNVISNFNPLEPEHGSTNNTEPSHDESPFTMSILAWERTAGVRMDISICPLALSLASGQVVALFRVDTLNGVLEWNKLVSSGVQLQTAINVPQVSLSLMRMPSVDFKATEVNHDERRTSLSVALEKARVDILKSQNDLTHSFVFRANIATVSGQVRPWRFLLDASVWADEQEIVSDLQSINYRALSASHQRPMSRITSVTEELVVGEHRLILFGANIQRVMLAVPLLNSEQPSSSRLALRATDLQCFARHRFHNASPPVQNTFRVKTHFIGVLWENSSLLSSHHVQVTIGAKPVSQGSSAHLGILNIVLTPGTWGICPRRDVLIAIIEAKNRKENKFSDPPRIPASEIYDNTTGAGDSIVEDSASHSSARESRLLVEKLKLRINRTSGFIEGLNDPDYRHPLKGSNGMKPLASKMSVPAFSVSVVRIPGQDFDLIDVDFTCREGEGDFPKSCLRRVASLFSDMLGLVTLEQERAQREESTTPGASHQHVKEVSRNLSLLVRFGGSLYRAQELVHSSIESKIGFFPGLSSTILLSVTKTPVIHEVCSYTTVITAVSPKLMLGITPLLEGADVQSLQFTNARVLYGMCPCHVAHSAIHINRITASIGAKTLLLIKHRLRQESEHSGEDEGQNVFVLQSHSKNVSRKVVLYLGSTFRRKFIAEPNDVSPHSDPDIRLQLKLSSRSKDCDISFIDLIIERGYLGMENTSCPSNMGTEKLFIRSALHDVILRGKWDILNFKLRLREHLFCFFKQNTREHLLKTSVSNIINRLSIENLQYQKHTLKLKVDALATMWQTPVRQVIFESTRVHAEVSHTLRKAVGKLVGQWKKLKSEVKLSTEREINNKATDGVTHHTEDETGDLSKLQWSKRLQKGPNGGDIILENSSGTASSENNNAAFSKTYAHPRLTQGNTETLVSIRGDELHILMRGYQFDETRHSAAISLLQYSVRHSLNTDGDARDVRLLRTDFNELTMSYNDDIRKLRSELFKIPKPQLRLSMIDTNGTVDVKLDGDLEVRLGHGFYNWQEFRELFLLTVRGIAPAPPREGTDIELIQPAQEEPIEDSATWDGRTVNSVDVQLHPRIDVIGDLTADVLPIVSARLKKQVDAIPRYMFGYIAIPLESLSSILCLPLEQQI